MTSTDITSLLSNTIKTLEAAAKQYDVVKDDNNLREAFHEAGRGLPLVRETLETTKVRLYGHDPAGDPPSATGVVEACKTKAEISESVFEEVAQAPETSRFERYKAAIGQRGRGSLVEVLVVGMMNDACTLINDGAMEAAMEAQAKKLRDAIEKLEKIEPSMPVEQSGNTFSHYGSGKMFNATGGIMNINEGSGKIITSNSVGSLTIN